MRRSVSLACLVLSVTLAPRSAHAAFITFTESTNGVDPIAVSTNLVLTAPTVATADSAIVTGFHHGGISPSDLTPGSRSAGLFEPGSTTLLSAYVLLTVGDFRFDPVFGLAQDISISFFTQNTLVTALPAGFPFGGGIETNGALQDLSALLGTLPEGLTVSARAQPAAVPEPTSLLLLGTGALGLVWKRIRAGTSL
jgi:hypothetical protein